MIDFLTQISVYGLLIAALVVSIMSFRITVLPLIMFFLAVPEVKPSSTTTTVRLNAHDFDEDY